VHPQYPALTYDLAHNRLFVTAAVLQSPVLDMGQPLPAQYGSYGAMIGHELTRAIDTKGRRIDATETLHDWWSPVTASAWDARIAPLAAIYSRFTYPGNAALKVDGARTRDENAADLSGLELAWAAYEKSEPQAAASNQQQFFRGWAKLWAQQLSAQTANTHAAISAYPPGQWRANVPAMQLPALGKAFGCKAGNAMLIAEAEQLSLWK
jgi:putative endopeptidase